MSSDPVVERVHSPRAYARESNRARTRAKIAIKYNLHRMADDSVDILRRLHEERKAALAICHEESPHAKLASFLSVTSTT
jgi:hypothetical protein